MVVVAADGTRVWLIDVAFFFRAILTRRNDEWTPKSDFHSLCPLPGAPKMSGERHLWDHREYLLRLVGHGVVERAGLGDQHGGILSRFGPQAMRNTLILLWCVYLVFLD